MHSTQQSRIVAKVEQQMTTVQGLETQRDE
jgi:hypothetical protein